MKDANIFHCETSLVINLLDRKRAYREVLILLADFFNLCIFL